MTTKRLLTGAAIGLVAGFASGYVGVGGGFLMVPLFISLLGITMKKASGTSLIAVVILAIPGVITQTLHGTSILLPVSRWRSVRSRAHLLERRSSVIFPSGKCGFYLGFSCCLPLLF